MWSPVILFLSVGLMKTIKWNAGTASVRQTTPPTRLLLKVHFTAKRMSRLSMTCDRNL